MLHSTIGTFVPPSKTPDTDRCQNPPQPQGFKRHPILSVSFVPMPYLEFSVTVCRMGLKTRTRTVSFVTACNLVDTINRFKLANRIDSYQLTAAGWIVWIKQGVQS